MSLPIFQKVNDQTFIQMQNVWSSQLNAILSIPMLSGLQLSNVSISIGVNNINHLLSRLQQGWFLTDISGIANIYRSKPFNSSTLILTSDAAVTASLWVY